MARGGERARLAYPADMNAIPVALTLHLAASSLLVAQELRTRDAVPYGPTPIALHGQDAGARWSGPWLGVDASHPVGLSSYWAFEDDVLDFGPFQSHGTAVGPTYSVDVPPAIAAWSTKSLSLVSANLDHVDLTPHVAKYADLNHGTIAVWLKASSNGALTILGASDSSDPSREIALSLSNGRPWYDVRGDLNSYSQVFTTSTINDGSWHHLCVVCEGNGVSTVYVDGAAVDTDHQGFFRYVFDLDSMSIGRNVDSGGPQWHFNGLLDDLTVWSSPLTPTDVQNLAQGALPPLAIPGAVVPVGPVVESGSLLNSGFLSNGLVPLGNKIVSETSARSGRSFPDIWDLTQNQTYYLSCMISRADTNAAIESAKVELTDSGATRGQFGWDATGTWFVGGGAATAGAEVMQANTPYFCVLRIDAVASGLEIARLKVFGPGAIVPTDDAGIATVGAGANQWTAESVPYASGAVMGTLWLTPTGNNRIELDELRMGTSWESVVRAGYGQGCMSAAIGAVGRPVLGSSFDLTLAGGAPNSVCGLVLGTSASTSVYGPLPLDLGLVGGPAGCFLLNSNDLLQVTIADPVGAAALPLAIPSSTTLYGYDAYAQWLSLDPASTAPLPLRMSDGYQVLVEN